MPISALGLGTHALPHVGSGKKNEVAVMVISFVPQIMLPKVRIQLIARSMVYMGHNLMVDQFIRCNLLPLQILQCDLEGVRRIVAELETDPTSDATIETVTKILEERCDGGRNIFHASVTMCQPTSNRYAWWTR